jgi:DNA repair exonuclease SbcCD ATPase subunit
LKDIQQTEKQIMLLNNYMLSVSKDGIPYMLIKKAIPVLKEQSNNILALLVDFTLDFKMDGKYINIYLINDNTNTKRSVELASGFERFIVSLAIRIAIIQISNLPKSNFLAIDEG